MNRKGRENERTEVVSYKEIFLDRPKIPFHEKDYSNKLRFLNIFACFVRKIFPGYLGSDKFLYVSM